MYNDNEKKFKLSNYVNLWLQVVFYGLVMTLLFSYLRPENVVKDDYFISLLPVTNKLYWYFTAYTGLYFLTPFINKAIRQSDRKTLNYTLIVIILLYTVLSRLTGGWVLLENDYSAFWLILLYIIGAIIKKNKLGADIKWYQSLICLIFVYFISYIWKINNYEFTFLNIQLNRNVLVTYASPTILVAAIMHIFIFMKFKFHKVFRIIIKFCSSSAFAIYLINVQRFYWSLIMNEMFNGIGKYRALIVTSTVIKFAFLFVIGAILIDKIRIGLFKILRIEKLTKKLDVLTKNLIV